MKRILLIFTLFIFYSPLMSKDFDFDKHLYGLKPGMKKDVALKLLDSKGVKYTKEKDTSAGFYYELSDSLNFFNHRLILMFKFEKNKISFIRSESENIPSSLLDLLKDDCNCINEFDLGKTTFHLYYYDNMTITIADESDNNKTYNRISFYNDVTKCKE